MDIPNLNSIIISDSDMFQIMKLNFPIEIDSFGSEAGVEVSIFSDYLNLFEGLLELEKFIEIHTDIEQMKDVIHLMTSDQICSLFDPLGTHQLIVDRNSHISFAPFHTLKVILQKRDINISYSDLLVVINNRIDWSGYLIERCRHFLSAYAEEVHNRNPSREIKNHTNLVESFKGIYELFRIHGTLFTACLKFQITKNTLNDRGLGQLNRITELLSSDTDLIWARYKLEDDGKWGVNLVCTLIYPFEAKKNFSRLVELLKDLPVKYDLESISNVYDWGKVLKTLAGMDVTGKIDSYQKLQIFLYWAVSPLYRYEEFFNYPNRENPEQILTFQRSWDQKLSVAIRRNKEFNLTFEKLGNYSTNEETVWSIKSLDKKIQSKLIQARIFYAELPSNNNIDGEFDTSILYYLDVLSEFLQASHELFFLFDSSIFYNKKVRLSRVGNQLVFLFRYMLKDAKVFGKICYINTLLGNRWSRLLKSGIWKTLERLHQAGSLSILNYQTLDLLNYQYKHSIFKENTRFGPKQSSIAIEDVNVLHTIDDLVFFEKRTIETQRYVKELLRKDQFIYRFQFQMQVDDSHFLSNKRFFSECFTEFRRVYERKKLLKNLSGYFMIWLKDKDNKPVADVIWLLDATPDFEYTKFSKLVQDAWLEFLTSFFSLEKNQNSIQSFRVRPKQLMYSVDLLKSPFLLVESTDSILMKFIINQLVPYFTYRHFFIPKFYNDPKMSTKLFTKGRITEPKKTRKDRSPKT